MRYQVGDPLYTDKETFERYQNARNAFVAGAESRAWEAYEAEMHRVNAENRGTTYLLNEGARRAQAEFDRVMGEVNQFNTRYVNREQVERMNRESVLKDYYAAVRAASEKKNEEVTASFWKRSAAMFAGFMGTVLSGGAGVAAGAPSWLVGPGAFAFGGGAATLANEGMRAYEKARQARGENLVNRTQLEADRRRAAEQEARTVENNITNAVNSARLAAFGGTPGAAVGAPRLERGSLTGSQAGEGSI